MGVWTVRVAAPNMRFDGHTSGALRGSDRRLVGLQRGTGTSVRSGFRAGRTLNGRRDAGRTGGCHGRKALCVNAVLVAGSADRLT